MDITSTVLDVALLAATILLLMLSYRDKIASLLDAIWASGTIVAVNTLVAVYALLNIRDTE